jgi:hypothetical protein
MGQNVGTVVANAQQNVERPQYQENTRAPIQQTDPYTIARRPNLSNLNQGGQFYQPIYRPSYDQESPFEYRQPSEFYQPPRSMMPAQTVQSPVQNPAYNIPYQNAPAPKTPFDPFRSLMQGVVRSFVGRPEFEPLLPKSPEVEQSLPSDGYEVPYMTKAQADAQANTRAFNQMFTAPAGASSGGQGFKTGGRIYEGGIDTLLKR